MNILLLVCMGAGAALAAQEGDRKTQTFSGILRHHKDLEGGVWTLKADGTVYDLHGDLKGLAEGDEVEIRGTVEKDKVCIHMVGTVFRLEAVRKKKPAGAKECAAPPRSVPSADGAHPAEDRWTPLMEAPRNGAGRVPTDISSNVLRGRL